MQGTSIVSALRMTAWAEDLVAKTPAVSRNRIKKIFLMVFNVKLFKMEGSLIEFNIVRRQLEVADSLRHQIQSIKIIFLRSLCFGVSNS